jgi:molybdopterin/thiamine biosynthesis adenylyltransferase
VGIDRHSRQARLIGVGREGQARLAALRADVPLDGLAADVAARYLAGAGVARVRVRTNAAGESARAMDPSLASGPSETPAMGLLDPVTQQLAHGAVVALRALRLALQGPS